MAPRWFASLLIALAACGGEGTSEPPDPPTSPEGCAPGELLEGERCLPPGILAEECSEGFEPDGAQGCRALHTDCPAGQVAWLGETSCHPVAPCPAGPWPEVTAEPGAQWVDSAYAGTDSDGTAEKPWTTLQAAFDVAAPGAQILMAAGTYVEDAVMRTDGLRLIGPCPDMARIEGVGADRPALFVNGADGASVTGITLTGPGAGLAVQDAADVVVEDLLVSAVGMTGVFSGPFTTDVLGLTMRRVVVEGALGFGVSIGGGTALLEDLVVRDVAFDGESGSGLSIVTDASLPPAVVGARRLVLRDLEGAGVATRRADLTLSDSTIAGIGPRPDARALWTHETNGTIEGVTIQDLEGTAAMQLTDGDWQLDRVTIRDISPHEDATGMGIIAAPVTTTSPTLDVRRSTIASVHTMALLAANTVVTLERLRIEDVGPDPLDLAGAGLAVMTYLDAGFGDGVAQLDARAVTVDRAVRTGLGLYGVKGSLESVAVRDALPSGGGAFGRCLDIEIASSLDHRSEITLADVEIGPCREGGIFLFGSTLNAERLDLHDVSGEAGAGYGLAMHYDPATFDAPMGSLVDSTIRDVTQAGVLVSGGGRFALDGVTISRVVADSSGLFGDGVVIEGVETPNGYVASEATLSSCTIEEVARAGVSSFGATVAIADNDLACNPIPLNHEPGPAGQGFVDEGGNECACGDEVEGCKALSSTLDAPEPPSPVGSPL